MFRAFAVLPFMTLLAIAAPEAQPIPNAVYQRAVKADIAQLQKHLEICAGDEKEAKRFGWTAKAMTGMLIRYAEALGDDALKSQAIKVGRKIDVKDWKGAMKEAEGFATAKADPALLKEAPPEFSLEVASSPFRGKTVGGCNIERDIRDMIKTVMPKAIEPEAVELLGVRTAVLAELHPKVPPSDWRDGAKAWVKEVAKMRDLSQALVFEAVKGEKADPDAIRSALRSLHASCSNCHFTDRNSR